MNSKRFYTKKMLNLRLLETLSVFLNFYKYLKTKFLSKKICQRTQIFSQILLNPKSGKI